MKKIFSLLLISFFVLSLSQEIHHDTIKWVTMDKAVELQSKNPKKIIIDFYTTWCGPCKLMYKNTFSNPDVVKYINENYYAVKFNAEGNEQVNFKGKNYKNPTYDASKFRNQQHEFTRYMGVNSYPTILFMGENAMPIYPLKGYQDVNEFEIFLKLFATNDYLTIKTPEDFEKWKTEHVAEFLK